MEYYLQIALGLVVLIGAVVPMSTDIKAIRVKNIVAAIAVMVLFGFILLNDYVAGFLRLLVQVSQNCPLPLQMAHPLYLAPV